jgi:hypothetical protein
MELTFQNRDRCLKAAGPTWADVVKTITFVIDFDEFQKCADVRMRYLGVATPTSTTVGVTTSRRTRFYDRDRGRPTSWLRDNRRMTDAAHNQHSETRRVSDRDPHRNNQAQPFPARPSRNVALR